MKLTVIGAGYVGLVTATCLAEIGHTVVCVDIAPDKIEKLNNGIMPIFEADLDDMVGRNARAGRLTFTTDLAAGMQDTKAVFIGVGTPTAEDEEGAADLSYVKAAAKEIAANIKDYTVVINKSTVPVGTAGMVSTLIKEANSGAACDVVSNPEFLREGNAIFDFMNPDRIVVGAHSKEAFEVMKEIYQPLIKKGAQYVETTPPTSELIKYASNAFLATKISFINEMANLCEQTGGDVEDLAKGIGLDSRIGPKFLKPGPGFGGSCFPKDTEALAHTARQYNAPVHIIESVIDSNTTRKVQMFEKIAAALGGSVRGKTIGVLGLTFKADTDDVRQSVSLVIVPLLQEHGAIIQAYDPQGMGEAKHYMPDLEYKDSAQEALAGADACVILTEWKEFVNLDWKAATNTMTQPLIVDLRNILNPVDVVEMGYSYTCIGRALEASTGRPQKTAAVNAA